MKYFRPYLLYFVLPLLITIASITMAQTDPAIQQQIDNCNKNSATEWSTSLNRCIGKTDAIENRKAAENCNTIENLSQREACHKALAEKNSGLSSDPKNLKLDNTNKSLMINAAYTIISAINWAGKGSLSGMCTSAKIMGVTAVAGVASDFYLKYNAKKKMDELSGKYKLEVKTNSRDAQVKALEYLKEEQKTVAEVASLEMKRNLILGLGYGAAGVMAAYELVKNDPCNSDGKTTNKESSTTDNATAVSSPNTVAPKNSKINDWADLPIMP